MQQKQNETDDIVKLKPIVGIRPGLYLTVLYSMILLAAVFILLVLPGIRNHGSVLIVTTKPQGAAIRVDGTYMGTTGIIGDRIFAHSGERTIEAVLPGFISQSAVHNIPGRILATRFFPRRYRIEFTLVTDDPSKVFALSAADFAAWTFGGEPTERWQIPLSLSKGAYRIGGLIEPLAAREILMEAANFTTTRAAMRDLLRAKMLIDNGGFSPSVTSITGSVLSILGFLSENPQSADWLAQLLPPELSSIVRASNWFKNNYPVEFVQASAAGRINIAGIYFINITCNAGNNFLISENPVTRTVFEQSEISSEQFAVINEYFPVREEITGVSWFEAKEFCKWLEGQLGPFMANMKVRLPTEAEWELAAASGIFAESDLWEWCADYFAPLRFNTGNRITSPELTLRRFADRENRASLPPNLPSPFVTFRPVIVEK